MKLPRAENAEISESKLCDYLLDTAHPDGASKARFFNGLGYSIDDWELLANDLRELAKTSTLVRKVESDHGTKYIVDGELNGPLGNPKPVRTIWIVDRGMQFPRLVTAYPVSGANSDDS